MIQCLSMLLRSECDYAFATYTVCDFNKNLDHGVIVKLTT